MMMTEHKRAAAWRGATKSSAGHRLGVSEPRSASNLRLIADSLGDRTLSSDLELALPQGVSTLVAEMSPGTSRLIAFKNRSEQLCDCSAFPTNGGGIAGRSGS